MEEGDGIDESWGLFNSDIIGEYRKKDRRRQINKENNTHFAANGSGSHLSPYTRLSSTRTISSQVSTPLSGQDFQRTPLSNITNQNTSKTLQKLTVLTPTQSPDPASGCPQSNVTTKGSSLPLKRKQLKCKSKVGVSGSSRTLFQDYSNVDEDENNSIHVDEIGLKNQKTSTQNPYQSTPPASDSPRSNITKIRSTLPFKRKPSAAKSKFKVCTSIRKLTEQDFNVTEEENSDLYDDQIETSRIRDLTDTNEDFDSEVQCSDDSSTDDEEMDNDSENDEGCLRTANDVQHGKVGSKYQIPEEYASLGGPSAKCSKCNALMWKDERVNTNVTKGTPLFSWCCRKGDVKLPEAPPTPQYLLELYINTGRGPYVYCLNGQNHHVFGSLIPDDGESPKFCQLYIYDTANEVNNRLRWVNIADQQTIDAQVVQSLIEMLDETNELVQRFRMARDRFENHELVDLRVELKVCHSQSGRENHIPASDEVAGIMVPKLPFLSLIDKASKWHQTSMKI